LNSTINDLSGRGEHAASLILWEDAYEGLQ
jgi:hypothetical protein